MSRILIPAAVILLIAAMFLVARPKFQNGGPDEIVTSDRVTNSATDSIAFPKNPSFPSRTKSKDRMAHRKPTLKETDDLLRNTIIPLVEIEDLSVGEATDKIRLLIQDAGIKSHDLQITCDLPAPDLQLRIKEMNLINVSIAEIFKSISGKTGLYFGVGPGVLQFNAPFNDRLQQSSSKPKPYDPFSGMSHEGEGADPFAEP